MASVQPPSQRVQVLEVLGNAIVGGMETCVSRLIARLPPDQFGVTVLCPCENELSEQLRSLGVEVYVTPMPDNPPWSAIQTVSALVKAQAVDVLHAHLPNAHLLSALVGKLCGKPVLTTIHGRQLSTLDLEVHRAAATHFSVVCRQTHLHALGLGVPPSQLHLIPNGADTATFTPSKERRGPLRQGLGIPEDAVLVGQIGRLSPEKGPDVFLRAALAAHGAAPDVHFVLVGEGPLRADLQELVARLGLASRVHFAGLRQDMASVYAELDIVVSASRSEAMPLALLEAMSCGLPVVATRVGGVPDLIQPGLSGWLVGDGDHDAMGAQIVSLVRDRALSDRVGQMARDRIVSQFSLDHSVTATAQLLRKLAQRSGDTRRVSAVMPGEAGKAASG
ncbi:MAG: glycosyltransferase [Aquabacterium sp.]